MQINLDEIKKALDLLQSGQGAEAGEGNHLGGYMLGQNNLSELTDIVVARTKLGLQDVLDNIAQNTSDITTLGGEITTITDNIVMIVSDVAINAQNIEIVNDAVDGVIADLENKVDTVDGVMTGNVTITGNLTVEDA